MSICDTLKQNEYRNKLYYHPYFEMGEKEGFSMEAASELLGQYWHPLHFFPDYLAHLITLSPDMDFKTRIADILNEELGEGKTHRAHERFYIDSMTHLGFSEEALCYTPMWESTATLMDCYQRGTTDLLTGLGGVYATESTDIAIVSGMGKLIRAATGYDKPIGWINIHVAQEPNHVEQTDHALNDISGSDADTVIGHAEDMWRCWIGFFDELAESASKYTVSARATA